MPYFRAGHWFSQRPTRDRLEASCRPFGTAGPLSVPCRERSRPVWVTWVVLWGRFKSRLHRVAPFATAGRSFAVAQNGSPNFVCRTSYQQWFPRRFVVCGVVGKVIRGVNFVRGYRPYRPDTRDVPQLSCCVIPVQRERTTPRGHWHDSHVGSAITQYFSGSGATPSLAPIAVAAMLPPTPPEEDTAFNSPPRPVDFSADVAAKVRR